MARSQGHPSDYKIYSRSYNLKYPLCPLIRAKAAIYAGGHDPGRGGQPNDQLRTLEGQRFQGPVCRLTLSAPHRPRSVPDHCREAGVTGAIAFPSVSITSLRVGGERTRADVLPGVFQCGDERESTWKRKRPGLP